MVSDEPKGTFGRRLKRIMKERGITQKGLAAHMDVANPYSVWRWVKGEVEPSYVMLKRMKAVLGCTWDELMGD